jgi:hypothetical protein
VSKEYAFVSEMESLRPKVNGAGNLERFDYWLHSFRYMEAMAHVNCLRAEFENAMKKVVAEKGEAQRRIAAEIALPLRKRLVEKVGEVYRYLLLTVSTNGELGTVANWDQHLVPNLLTKPGEELAGILGETLPAEALPKTKYVGEARIIVPTLRTSFQAGEVLKLKVIVLCDKPPRELAFYSRPLGEGEFTKKLLVHVARSVYTVEHPTDSARALDLEYYIEILTLENKAVRFPASAPEINQTVVVLGQTAKNESER